MQAMWGRKLCLAHVVFKKKIMFALASLVCFGKKIFIVIHAYENKWSLMHHSIWNKHCKIAPFLIVSNFQMFLGRCSSSKLTVRVDVVLHCNFVPYIHCRRHFFLSARGYRGAFLLHLTSNFWMFSRSGSRNKFCNYRSRYSSLWYLGTRYKQHTNVPDFCHSFPSLYEKCSVHSCSFFFQLNDWRKKSAKTTTTLWSNI